MGDLLREWTILSLLHLGFTMVFQGWFTKRMNNIVTFTPRFYYGFSIFSHIDDLLSKPVGDLLKGCNIVTILTGFFKGF